MKWFRIPKILSQINGKLNWNSKMDKVLDKNWDIKQLLFSFEIFYKCCRGYILSKSKSTGVCCGPAEGITATTKPPAESGLLQKTLDKSLHCISERNWKFEFHKLNCAYIFILTFDIVILSSIWEFNDRR